MTGIITDSVVTIVKKLFGEKVSKHAQVGISPRNQGSRSAQGGLHPTEHVNGCSFIPLASLLPLDGFMCVGLLRCICIRHTQNEREKGMTAELLGPVDSDVRLTKRESEVLGLVIEGKSNKEVATELYCSKRTVDFHLARIYEKLQVNNRIQAVRRATSLGLISPLPRYLD